jgi:Whirly transcription factor
MKCSPGIFACAGDKQYDWTKKQKFALSVTEIAAIVEFPNEAHSFVHDPGALTDKAKEVLKTFKVRNDVLWVAGFQGSSSQLKFDC